MPSSVTRISFVTFAPTRPTYMSVSSALAFTPSPSLAV